LVLCAALVVLATCISTLESPKSDEMKFQICMGKPVIGLDTSNIAIHETLRCHPFTDFNEVQKKVADLAGVDNKVRFRSGKPTNSTQSLMERFSAMLPAERRFQFQGMKVEEGIKSGDDAFTVCALDQSVLKSASEYFEKVKLSGNQHPMLKVKCLKWQTAAAIMETFSARKSSSFVELGENANQWPYPYPIFPITDWTYYPMPVNTVVPPFPYADDNGYNDWSYAVTFPDYGNLYDGYIPTVPYGGAPYYGYWNGWAW